MKTDCLINFVRRLLLIGLALFILSCGSAQETRLPAPYVANDNLVDPPHDLAEINLQFSPPKGWTEADSATLNQFSEMLAGTALSTEFYPIAPQIIFRDSATGVIAYVASIPGTSDSFEKMDQRYKEFILKNQGNAGLDQKRYLVNGLKLTQYIMHTPKVVNYKILGEVDSTHRFLIEYIINGSLYGELEPSVSASLAALKQITPSQDK